MDADFFISYAFEDEEYAAWIAGVLVDEDYDAVLAAWDCPEGTNFVRWMNRAVKGCRASIAILSDDYLKSDYCEMEWTAMLPRDPTQTERRLIPVRIDGCRPTGLLASLAYLDISNADEAEARAQILRVVRGGSRRPKRKPSFPGKPGGARPVQAPSFQRSFSPGEWERVQSLLTSRPERFGVPAARDDTFVVGSWNIRKLGSQAKRSPGNWQFLAETCRHFDLLAIQEVQEDTSGIEHLVSLLGGSHAVTVSEPSGRYPGERGLLERAALLYRKDRIELTGRFSVPAIGRSHVQGNLVKNFDAVRKQVDKYKKEMARHEAGERRSRMRPHLTLPVFLAFHRQPIGVGLRVLGSHQSRPYELLVFNAHLLYGHQLSDRQRELDALMDWMTASLQEGTEQADWLLAGGLQLERSGLKALRDRLEPFLDATSSRVEPHFPFLLPHAQGRGPTTQDGLLATNVRISQTFDQVGFFVRDNRLAAPLRSLHRRRPRPGVDYGVINITDLICESTTGKPFAELDNKARRETLARFEHSVSDHLPLWVRLPLPT